MEDLIEFDCLLEDLPERVHEHLAAWLARGD